MSALHTPRRFPACARTLALIGGLFLLAAVGSPAQEADAAQSGTADGPRAAGLHVLLFPLLQVGDAPELATTDTGIVELLSRSLLSEFEDAGEDLGFEVVVGEPRPRMTAEAPPGGVVDAAIDAASAADADLVGVGFAGFSDGRVSLNARVYDTDSRGLISAAAGYGRSDLSVFNITRRLFEDLRPGLERRAGGRGRTIVDVAGDTPVSDPLVLSSELEGMHVYLGDNLRLGTITDGEVRLPYLPFTPGETVSVRKVKRGYYEETEEVLIREGGSRIELAPMEPETRFAATVSYTTGQLMGLGVGVRAYIRPDWSFFAGETYGYVQSSNPGATGAAYHQDFRLLFGRYLAFPRTSVFRFGAHTGVGTTFTFFSSPDADTYRDTYLEVFSLWLEANLGGAGFYAGVASRWSVGRDNGLLEAGSIGPGFDGPFITLGSLVKWQK